jgi:hypothetical protein
MMRQFRVTQKNTDGAGHDTELTIDREDDGEIRITILEGVSPGTHGADGRYSEGGLITLSAAQVAALRQWLVT